MNRISDEKMLLKFEPNENIDFVLGSALQSMACSFQLPPEFHFLDKMGTSFPVKEHVTFLKIVAETFQNRSDFDHFLIFSKLN